MGRIFAFVAALSLVGACIVHDPPSAIAPSPGAASSSAVAVELPVPPGPGPVPRPVGNDTSLHVLPWAGFAAAVSYTFDDSQPSQIDHWSELKAEGVRSTFYVNPSGNSYPGYDAMLRDAIAQGSEIGNHTVHHCHADLSGCQSRSIVDEIEQCSSYITNQLGQSGVWTFAAPFGDSGYEPRAQQRFFLARGVGPGTIAPNDASDPFNLPALGAKGGEPASAFNEQIDAARAQGRWLILLFHSIIPTQQNWYAGVDVRSITGSMEHAKALGSVWLDSVVNIGAYWLGAQLVQASAPRPATTATTWTWTLPPHFPPGHRVRVRVDGGTLAQGGKPVAWDERGYYEVSLDAGSLSWQP